MTAYATAMHLISEHADPMAVARSPQDNDEQHDYEHTGPCTIKFHVPVRPGPRLGREWLGYDEAKVEAVLEEAETTTRNS